MVLLKGAQSSTRTVAIITQNKDTVTTYLLHCRNIDTEFHFAEQETRQNRAKSAIYIGK